MHVHAVPLAWVYMELSGDAVDTHPGVACCQGVCRLWGVKNSDRSGAKGNVSAGIQGCGKCLLALISHLKYF